MINRLKILSDSLENVKLCEKVLLQGEICLVTTTDNTNKEEYTYIIIGNGTSLVRDLKLIPLSPDLSGKVDKVEGKGLSTNDLTNALLEKLEGLSNYDDTTIKSDISKIQIDLVKIESKNDDATIESLGDIIKFLSGISDANTLKSLLDSLSSSIVSKIETHNTSSSAHKDIRDTIPTNLGQLSNEDTKFVNKNDLEGKVDKVEGKSLISDTEITRLAGVSNYDDTSVKKLIGDEAERAETAEKSNLDKIVSLQSDVAKSITSISVGTTTTVDPGTNASVSKSGTDRNPILNFSIPKGASEFEGVQEISGSIISMSLKPNIFYIFGEVTSLSLLLETPSDKTRVNEYLFQFTSGSTATTLTLPGTIKWIGNYNIVSNTIYQVSIVNDLAIRRGASNS